MRPAPLVRTAAVAAVATMLLASVTSCTGDGERPGRAGRATTTAADAAAAAASRIVTEPTGDRLRLEIAPERPLFLYNVYVGTEPDVMDRIVDLWPDDLRHLLGFQIVFPSKPPMPEADRAAALAAFLERSDALDVPTLVQTVAFTGRTGPSDDELADGFAEHPSLVGVAAAELSADYATSVGGLSPVQKELLAGQIRVAAAHRALFLWADMGYFGPQVFVDAGADPALAPLLREHHRNVVVQVKQNGSGRRFGTWSAAAGLAAAGYADHWGVNSEDWLWWEASFESLFAPQVPGGLGVTGMARSDRPNLSRLTFPEALFGIEMLVAASAGATVFSIEAPARGTVDPTHGTVSPAGEHVVFPLLRRLVDHRLIPSREQVAARTPVALQPAGRDVAALATDAVFDDIGGPEGCAPDDRVSCTQRQWLPSTGRYGLVPTIPALAGDDVRSRFDEVVTLTDATTAADVRAAADTRRPDVSADDGDSWIGPSADDRVWFVANPNENRDGTTTFRRAAVSGTLAPHTFAIVDERRGTILLDGFRTDTSSLWATPADAAADEALASAPLDDLPVAEPGTDTIRIRTDAERLVVRGAESVRQERSGDWLELSITHRRPVRISL